MPSFSLEIKLSVRAGVFVADATINGISFCGFGPNLRIAFMELENALLHQGLGDWAAHVRTLRYGMQIDRL